MFHRLLRFSLSLVLVAVIYPSQSIALDGRTVIVAIDAGHGGRDVGAIGVTGVYEKDINLSVSEKLAVLINQTPGMKAIQTRRGDVYIKLRTRLAVARNEKADLFGITKQRKCFFVSRMKSEQLIINLSRYSLFQI